MAGGLAERETPEPLGPRKRVQEGSEARVVKRKERNARRAAEMDVIRGDTGREVIGLGGDGKVTDWFFETRNKGGKELQIWDQECDWNRRVRS